MSETSVSFISAADIAADPRTIQHLDRRALLALQERCNLGRQWGTMQFPREWLPQSSAVISHGTIRIPKKIYDQTECDVDRELIILTVTRLTLLLFLVPLKGSGRSNKILAVRTIAEEIGSFIRLFVQLAISIRQPTRIPGLLSRIDRSAFMEYRSTLTGRQVRALDAHLQRLKGLQARELWDDVPAVHTFVQAELPRKFRPDIDNSPVRAVDPHRPFSDEFISEASWRAAWLAQNIAEQLAQTAKKLMTISKRYKGITAKKSRKQTLAEEKLLGSIVFRGVEGHQIVALPFEITVGIVGRTNELLTWPPTMAIHVFAWLEKIQAAHLFILLLSTGGRISEVLSLQTNCISRASSASGITTADGRTYKLVLSHEGAERDWPLPPLAVEVIRNQVSMARALAPNTEPGPLWRNYALNGFGNPLSHNYRNQLKNLVSSLSLNHLLGTQNMRAHRFRKSIARLVALAIVESPKVLMDIFGHRSIDMTMGYILADPLIRAEVDTVRRELVMMFAEKAIESADTNGGAAAAPLKDSIRTIKIQRGDDWGVDDIKDLAFTLTANGEQWALVRPGVLCTKQGNQTGPCNANHSAPDPARCRTSCAHRLEEGAMRDDAHRSVQQAVEHIEKADADGDEIQKELWAGQVLAHLRRFDSVFDRWKGHPAVRPLLAEDGNV
jgi:integrase